MKAILLTWFRFFSVIVLSLPMLLTLCMMGNLRAFCRLLITLKINFFKKVFQEYHQCQTARIQIRSDGPECARLSADDKINYCQARTQT